ncbi:MAG: 50S ribosomal protein L28 [Anaerolineae bacterium]
MTVAKCEICGKITAFGNNVSHSKRATKRMFRPNLQKTIVYEHGRRRHIVTCAKCLKKMRSS